MNNHFVGYAEFSSRYLDNTEKNKSMVKNFLKKVRDKYSKILDIGDNYIDNLPFVNYGPTIQTLPIPLNCELTRLMNLQILELTDIRNIPDKMLGFCCHISGKFLSFEEEEICVVNSYEYLDNIERYNLWTGIKSDLFGLTVSTIDIKRDFIPFTAQHINEIDEDYIYYDFNTVYGIDIFLKAMFTSYYDDIVNYHMERLIPIPSAILDIISSEYLESDDKLQDFLLLAKEIFNKYAHTNFAPESIQLITLTGNGYDIELFHKNFSKSLNYMMQELISEASNYLII